MVATQQGGPRVRAEAAGTARERAFTEALDELARRRDEFADQHFVPRDYIGSLKRAGFFRAATPLRFGGEPLPPAEFMRMVERVSEVDPATGWVASFGSATTYLSALPIASQERIYAAGPDLVFAAGMFPMQRAEQVPGGYLVSGTWQFASGCKGADLLGLGLAGGAAAGNRPLTAVIAPEQVEIVDNWDVAGMRGTGSHAVRADNVFIASEMTFIRGADPTIDEPLGRYPILPYAAQVLAVVTLGAARGALNHAHTAGAAKTSITGGGGKGARPSYQAGLARAEADLRSARAFFYQATGEVWERALLGAQITDEDRTLLRLAATQAAHVGRRVILEAFDLAGTGAIYRNHPMQRFLQDGVVPAQHAMLQTATYESAGAVLLGLTPSVPSFP